MPPRLTAASATSQATKTLVKAGEVQTLVVGNGTAISSVRGTVDGTRPRRTQLLQRSGALPRSHGSWADRVTLDLG